MTRYANTQVMCAALTAVRDSERTWAAYLDARLTARTGAACRQEAPPSDGAAAP
ncbi:hypothetical protein [Myxococcus sp. CA040A]|uniref:hypothetical protein n=1 Tax=Myxococcus sp. CA040A TaxID=2741738 RepID=UPI00157AC505|nr:hypothetical protein [Myxococcus sp. CA040A]NTX07095.1 hypothetical protein [Myxococcus sp. CA040A]